MAKSGGFNIDKKTLNILEALMDRGPCTYYGVGKELDIDSSKAKYHLNKLVEIGAVSKINVEELKKEAEENGEDFYDKKSDEIEVPPAIIEKVVKRDFNGKYLYAVKDTKMIVYRGMIIQFIEGQPIVYNCKYWDQCPHHNCGQEDCLLVKNGPDFIKKLLTQED